MVRTEGLSDAMAAPTLLIAEPARRGDAEAAVAAAGGRLLGQVVWADAPLRLARQSAVRVVLAEARGVDPALLAPSLAGLDALALNGDARVVVTLDFAQIDLFAATLTASGIDLLCEPSDTERFAALCVAGLADGARVRDVAGESEAARLQRLHEEVARIAETLTRLTRDEPRSRALAEPGTSYRSQPASKAPDVAARDVREAIRARRLRDQYFGHGLFEDPAWDMLLDLFAAELERAQVSVSSLCIAAAVAPTTALRWITRMTDAGLFVRQPDPFDRRRAFMALSARASAGMRDYVAAVGRMRGGIA